jgi:hypothetical protein
MMVFNTMVADFRGGKQFPTARDFFERLKMIMIRCADSKKERNTSIQIRLMGNSNNKKRGESKFGVRLHPIKW